MKETGMTAKQGLAGVLNDRAEKALRELLAEAEAKGQQKRAADLRKRLAAFR